MPSPAKISLKRRGDTETVKFTGSFDRGAEDVLDPLLKSDARVLRFDFSGLTFIGSVGMRTWIRFFERASPSHELVFDHCPVALVQQLNMIPGMLFGAKVHSFALPFYCETCEKDLSLEIEVGQQSRDHLLEAAAPSCPKCQSQATLDADEAYLDFLYPAA